MEQKLKELYLECVQELNKLGIDILDEKQYGKIDIFIAKRNNKRYKIINKVGRRRIIRYERFNKHHIEISPWVMALEESIIKNTIMHELIHCIPFCNNHGSEFKKYANMINTHFGYDVSRVGNKKNDFEKSNINYNEKENYNYKIICKGCNQFFYRKRLNKGFTRKYRCAKCGGKFEVISL